MSGIPTPHTPTERVTVTQRQDGPAYADPADVERAAADWPDEFLDCRTDQHAWRAARATFNTALRYWYQVKRCGRCGTERHRELTERGHPTATWYVYPDGYLLKGLGRIVGDGRDALNLASLTRSPGVTRTRRASEAPHSLATRRALGVA